MYTYIRTYVCMYVCIHNDVYTYVCMSFTYVCMYVCIIIKVTWPVASSPGCMPKPLQGVAQYIWFRAIHTCTVDSWVCKFQVSKLSMCEIFVYQQNSLVGQKPTDCVYLLIILVQYMHLGVYLIIVPKTNIKSLFTYQQQRIYTYICTLKYISTKLYRAAERKLLVDLLAHVETGTNS